MCQRHSRDIKALGFASAFFLIEQVSQAIVFSVDGVGLVFMSFSYHGEFLENNQVMRARERFTLFLIEFLNMDRHQEASGCE